MADLDLTAAIEAARLSLVADGADDRDGWHSWRCFDRARYPKPCTCTEDSARDALEAALPYIARALTRNEPR